VATSRIRKLILILFGLILVTFCFVYVYSESIYSKIVFSNDQYLIPKYSSFCVGTTNIEVVWNDSTQQKYSIGTFYYLEKKNAIGWKRMQQRIFITPAGEIQGLLWPSLRTEVSTGSILSFDLSRYTEGLMRGSYRLYLTAHRLDEDGNEYKTDTQGNALVNDQGNGFIYVFEPITVYCYFIVK
jgi:hypothetical protein